MGWLGDTVVLRSAKAAWRNLKKLTEVFGVEWASEAIIPKVMAMGAHPTYLYRNDDMLCHLSVSDHRPR